MSKVLLTIFFSLVITLTMFGLNSWANEHDQADSKQKTVTVIGNIVGEESNKGKVQCPVTKNWFVQTEKSPSTVYKEKTYYFCCAGCKPQFEKEPEKYLK